MLRAVLPLRRDERGTAGMWVGLFLATILVALLIVAGQLGGRKPATAPVTPVSTAASPAPTGEEALVARLKDETAEVRDLRFEHRITATFLSPEAFEDEIRQTSDESDVGQGLPDERVLKAFGIIPEDSDLTATLREASASGVVGYYDPDTERLVVKRRGDTLTPLAQTTLVHELTHAVTDQHFDLSSVLSGDEPDDEALSRTALVEGDAVLTMQRWSQEKLSLGDQFALGLEAIGDLSGTGATQTPPRLEQLLMFPYLEGLAFVQALYDRGGWCAVNRAYRHPPVTTEQVLHPDKYLAGEGADRVTVRVEMPGFREAARGNVGEEFLSTLLGGGGDLGALLPGFPSAEPDSAKGWNGGGYVVLTGKGGAVVVLQVHWDTVRDAGEFERDLPRVLDATPQTSRRRGVQRFSLGGSTCLEIDGQASAGTTVTFFPFACAMV